MMMKKQTAIVLVPLVLISFAVLLFHPNWLFLFQGDQHQHSKDRFEGLFPVENQIQKFPKCGDKRLLLRGLLTKAQCNAIKLLGKNNLAKENVGDNLKGAALESILGRSFNRTTIRLLMRTRSLILKTISHHFKLGKSLCVEFTHLTARTSGEYDYSHGVHADNCRIDDLEKRICVSDPDSCCAWRSHSSIMFLSNPPEFEGAEFFFEDQDDSCLAEIEGVRIEGNRTYITPQCGTLVSFTSGVENVHGVAKVKSGTRWALASWFTQDCDQYEEMKKENDQRTLIRD